MTRRGRIGALLLLGIAVLAAAAPLLTPHNPGFQFQDRSLAPPMRPRLVDATGALRAPFVYPLRLANRLERRYEEDRSRPTSLRWFSQGTLVSIDESSGPWLPLGADALGRDVFARLVYGARLSLGVALAASIGALLLAVLAGAPAGFRGGRTDAMLMAVADFVVVLPAIYVVLAFRAALPLVLSPGQVFAALTLVLSAAGWPVAARGVRAVIAAEKRREYAEAAYAMGAAPLRILQRHLLPATYGFLLNMWTLLVPAFVLTEATLSLVGLGFPPPTATWGSMLREAAENRSFTEAPWLLAPAVAIVCCVVPLQMMGTRAPDEPAGPGTFG